MALLFIMPTVLRGCVPNLHDAFCDLILGLRILHGMVYSPRKCRSLHIEPGSYCLKKADIDRAHTLIVQGLSKLEGSMPVRVLTLSLITLTLTLTHTPLYAHR